VSYWTPRADAPIRTCPGGQCERKTDCRRFLEHKWNEGGEKFNLAPYATVKVIEGWQTVEMQFCDEFLPRES